MLTKINFFTFQRNVLYLSHHWTAIQEILLIGSGGLNALAVPFGLLLPLFFYLMIQDLEGEIWKDIKNYEGYYQVSNKGRVKSLDREVNRIRKTGIDATFVKGRLMALTNHHGLYKRIDLMKNGITEKYLIHRLVADAFLDNPENKPCVNHKDGNPSNNCVENLEWCTYKENCNHAWQAGLSKAIRGEQIGTSKLKEDQVRAIKEDWRNGLRNKAELGRKYNIDRRMIFFIVENIYWKHIT